MAGAGEGRLTTEAIAEARASFLALGRREATAVAAAIEGLATVPAFSVMATASLAARPQWAGLVDDLFERPLLKNARAGLRNALASTLAGDSLYRSVFFSFADFVILWHYGHTQERTGPGRIDTIYGTILRLLQVGKAFSSGPDPEEPDIVYFHRLRRVRLTQDNAYPVLRRATRLLGAVEAEITGEKLRLVRGSMLTSYVSFSAQVIAMAEALREGRDAISQGEVGSALSAVVRLIETPPAAPAA